MKVKFKNRISILLMIMLVLMALSCKKTENDPSLNLPTLTTYDATAISSSSAQCGGNILSDGGFDIIQRGVCYSTHASPTTSDSITKDGDGAGNFTSYLTGLLPETKYFIRAYAINSYGTSYGSSVTITTTTDVLTIKDIENNIYKIVKIGTQTWMAEDLRTTKFKNGQPIPKVSDFIEWTKLVTPAYCWYDNDSITYSQTYGALYNWYTVNTGNICPSGWHVPTDIEWTTLIDYLGGIDSACGKLKDTGTIHWLRPNTDATNESDFSAIPGGWRYTNGLFEYVGVSVYWWSATEYSISNGWLWNLDFNSNYVFHYYQFPKQIGSSVRCIKD
jgi:uncharacterized protein (TIGR02145 family)